MTHMHIHCLSDYADPKIRVTLMDLERKAVGVWTYSFDYAVENARLPGNVISILFVTSVTVIAIL